MVSENTDKAKNEIYMFDLVKWIWKKYLANEVMSQKTYEFKSWEVCIYQSIKKGVVSSTKRTEWGPELLSALV